MGKGLSTPFSRAIEEMSSWWESLKKLVSAGLSSVITVTADTSGVSDTIKQGLNITSAGTNVAYQAIKDISTQGTLKTNTGTVLNTTPVVTYPTTSNYQSSTAGMPDDVKRRLGLMASGGFPMQGSLFVAGESGAELVGNINGRTGVANNDQITEAMYYATYDAMSKALQENGMNVTIEGDTNKIFRVVRKDAKDFFDANGFSPFPV